MKPPLDTVETILVAGQITTFEEDLSGWPLNTDDRVEAGQSETKSPTVRQRQPVASDLSDLDAGTAETIQLGEGCLLEIEFEMMNLTGIPDSEFLPFEQAAAPSELPSVGNAPLPLATVDLGTLPKSV